MRNLDEAIDHSVEILEEETDEIMMDCYNSQVTNTVSIVSSNVQNEFLYFSLTQ